MIEMRQIHRTATRATGYENPLRWKGPLTKSLRFQSRMAIGIPYEMYSPIVAILFYQRIVNQGQSRERRHVPYLVAAENATLLPKLGSPKTKDNKQASQTVLIGDLVFGSTSWKNLCPGIPPSRAKAYIMRELDVMENTLVWDESLAARLYEG